MVRCLLFSSFILFALSPLANSSGHIDIYLKSSVALNATVEVADGISWFTFNEKYFNFPLLKNQESVLRDLPIRGIVKIRTGSLQRFGMKEFELVSQSRHREAMTVTSKTIRLPFTGFKIEMKCDKNWYGPECDQFCDDHEAALIGKRCNHMGQLGCQKGYRGWHCDQLISLVYPSCNCQNNGTCVNSFWWQYKHDSLICECPNGFRGEKCEKKLYDTLELNMNGQEQEWPSEIRHNNSDFVVNEFNK